MAAYTSYAEVPWFRKSMHIWVGLFVFAPATLYPLFTGDIYYEKNGQIVAYSKNAKLFLTVLCSIATLGLVANILGMK